MTMQDSREHMPATEKWQFDTEVTDVFADMLERSIPQYAVMRETVTAYACAYAKKHTTIVDIGCSQGDALAYVYEKLGDKNSYIGVECSAPMIEHARQRFTGAAHVTLYHADIRELTLVPASASVVLSVLTLQFIPIEYRQHVLKGLYDTLTNKGALILVEKVLGANAQLNDEMVRQYYAMKRQNGYSEEAIMRKKLALEGVLVPVTAAWNEDLLRQAGFTSIDCFWRWNNFAGWIAQK